ncbi:MAG TPA: FHA domain-containing protein [Steroidobacteraceae bacterium]|jgi:chromosome segregation ATPase
MNASSKSFSSGSADAEITAELPVLDVAAHEARYGQDPLSSTDTWSSPTLSTAILPQLANLASESTPEPTLPAHLSARLEAELKSLASNLAELETRLAAKGERLAIIEAELAESRSAGQAAATRAAQFSEELAGARTAVAAATIEIEGLRSTLTERDEIIRVAAERESELRRSHEQHAAEIASTVAAEAAKNAARVAQHESARNAAQQQVAQLQAQGAAQLEALHSMEGRRGIFDSILRALDMQVVGRDREQARLVDDLARNTTHGLELTRELDARSRRVTQLEAEVVALNSRLGARMDEAGVISRTNEELNQSVQALRQESAARAARIAELEAQLVAASQMHAEALRAAAAVHSELQEAHAALSAKNAAQDAELLALREQSAEHVAAVQQVTTEHANRLAQIEAGNVRITALTAQVATQARTIQTEAEQHRAAEERLMIAENDLQASQDAINRLESEVRSRSMHVEELTRTNSQMQEEIAEAKRWLEERDALMQRLETEAAHSSALVDNIQRSIRSLAPGSTGSHELVRDNGARLLIRSQGGHEVVHVLGRKTTIGRTPDNDLQIDASFISRHHAVLLLNGPQSVIEDLNSTNGVYVNGQRVSREILNDGDLVAVGKARFRFVVRPAAGRSNPESSA